MDDVGNSTLMRQWSMLRHIPRHPARVGVGDLAEVLELEGHQVSRRTIERDLHALAAQFPLTVDERSKPFGWSWAKGAGLHVLPKLTPAQGVAMLLAKQHLRGLLPAPLERELGPLFDAAQKTLASTGWRDWHRRTAVVPAGLPLLPPRVSRSVLDRVQAAIAGGRCLEADYRAKGRETSRRMLIHPHGLLARGPVVYLVGTLFDYEDMRQLALHRLDKVRVLTQPRLAMPGFDVADYAAGQGGRIGSQGSIQLVARFDAAAAEHLHETPVSTDQSLIPVEDGERVELRATVDDDDQLHWWLLAFGPQVEVISPRALRESQAAAHRAASLRYRGR